MLILFLEISGGEQISTEGCGDFLILWVLYGDGGSLVLLGVAFSLSSSSSSTSTSSEQEEEEGTTTNCLSSATGLCCASSLHGIKVGDAAQTSFSLPISCAFEMDLTKRKRLNLVSESWLLGRCQSFFHRHHPIRTQLTWAR